MVDGEKLKRDNVYPPPLIRSSMNDDVMNIENTPQLRSFIQLWMMSGGMVLATVKEILNDKREIEMPEMPGRDFKSEIIELSSAFNTIVTRLK